MARTGTRAGPKAFRNTIITWPDNFRRMTAALKKGKLALETEGALKRMPKEFETVTDPELAAALKLKHFYISEKIDPALITTPKLIDISVDFAKRALPLIEWGRANSAD